MTTSNLSEAFASFVEAKKEEKAEPVAPVETAAPPAPPPSPVIEEEDGNPFAAIRDKVKYALQYLYANMPHQLRWMFKSLGWVLVGAIVSAAAMGASYFLLRYLVWFLILALGKWLLEQIRRRIPKMGGAFVQHVLKFEWMPDAITTS